ncbi:DNA primase [Patescibacteria group bacterium]|nr:DNA primase [Patescibacteria group bacterium]MCL5091432.1 DNA primase [Patescibacteria group bacterium]
MDNQIEEVKKKADIVELIGSYITLKKVGRNYKANCPFHQEKTASFIVSPERQIWHCFGSCGEGGDAIKFMMKWENIPFGEALRELADRVGVKLKRVVYQEDRERIRERLFTLNGWAAHYFQYILWETRFGKHCHNYLVNERQLTPGIIKKFGLGYAPQSWESLTRFLTKKGFSREEAYAAGLVAKNDRQRYYDRFRGRLVFPLKDSRGQIVGFSGRWLGTGTGPKYINTPETPIYHKRETLFGIDLAKEAIKKNNAVLIVEGEFDMIVPYQYGFENVVAIKGAAVTQEQLLFLKRYAEKINLALDTDQAGIEAMKRAIQIAEPTGMEIGVVQLDFAKDPDEAVRKDKDKFRRAFNHPVSFYDFLIDTARKQYPENTAYHKKKISDAIVPYLNHIRNPVIQSHYVRKLAEALEVSTDSLEALMRQRSRSASLSLSEVFPAKAKTRDDRKLSLDKYLLSLVFQSDNPYVLVDTVFAAVTVDDFSLPAHRKIVQAFIDWRHRHPEKFDAPAFCRQLPPELEPVINELFLFATLSESRDEDNEILKDAYEIKRLSLKEQIVHASRETDHPADDRLIADLNSQLRKVEKSLSAL